MTRTIAHAPTDFSQPCFEWEDTCAYKLCTSPINNASDESVVRLVRAHHCLLKVRPVCVTQQGLRICNPETTLRMLYWTPSCSTKELDKGDSVVRRAPQDWGIFRVNVIRLWRRGGSAPPGTPGMHGDKCPKGICDRPSSFDTLHSFESQRGRRHWRSCQLHVISCT